MRARSSNLLALLLLAAVGFCSGQEAPTQDTSKPPEPLFVRIAVYPTVSLSRYDYNNDIDLYEVRVYVELRRGSQEGQTVADARISALAENLEYQTDHYEKRIILGKDRLPAEVEVEIADTGVGIPRENLTRLFDPFFTTKSSGTGLGLSVTYGIIERHGGTIEVKSEVGRGSVFTIKFPAAKEGDRDAGHASETNPGRG